MPTLKPLGDRYLIDPGKDELKTKAGLYLPPATIPENPVEGVVVDRGPNCTLFNRGDRVLFQRHSAFKVSFGLRGEQTYLVLHERDLVCEIILTPEEEEELNAPNTSPQAVNPSARGEGLTSRDFTLPVDFRSDPRPEPGY